VARSGVRGHDVEHARVAFGRRPNAVFEYVGPAAERDDWLHAEIGD
jgi:hypothetical protein